MRMLVLFLSLTFCHFGQAEGPKRRPVPKLPPLPKATAPLTESQLSRVDPHGDKSVKPTLNEVQNTKECSVCHDIDGSRLTTRPTALESCLNCHNKSPHSGIEEHMKHKIQCTSCHTFHRGDAVPWSGSSGRFKGLHAMALPSGLREKNSKSAMLKKTCTDCHKW